MYCHFCRVDGSPSHDSGSGHRAAKELASTAVGRLSEHFSASIEDHPSCRLVNQDDFLKINFPEPPGETKKTDEKTDVFFCATCNVAVAVYRHSNSMHVHCQQKQHTLALYNEQTLKELVGQYVDKEHQRLMIEPMPEPQVAIDQSEAAKTYTCHLCGVDVPAVYKYLHEDGIRHLASRALAAAASKRTRDALRGRDKPQDKSEDKSEDKPKDGSGDRPKDKPKFTGKMMKKLLKLYTGKGIDDSVEDTDGEIEEPRSLNAKRLSPKEYFTDILPYLSYVSSFHTVIVDDTEYVTIQIGRDTLKIHANSYHGINHYEDNGTYYMRCHLCDGYDTSVVYSSAGQQDKLHVLSLGHIRNLLTRIENVHMIRKIDETHAVCSLCNVYMAIHIVENHIMKSSHHTAALFEALERGKTYKDSKKHLKIMIANPSTKNVYSYNQNKLPFEIPQAQLRQNSGVLFGGAQGNNFGSAQIPSQNSANDMLNKLFSQNKPGFGAQNKPDLFGGAQGNNFGSAQIPSQNSANDMLNKLFSQNIPGFGAQNKPALFGGAQNNTCFTYAQNAFGSAQNTAFGSQNNGASVQTLNARFGGQESTGKTPNKKAAQPKIPTSSEKNLKTFMPVISNNAEKSTQFSPENKNGDGKCEANNGTDSLQAKHDIDKTQETEPKISYSSSDSE